ncbi:hypothetical protein NUU61_009570 [Penicillium alfredii]|uniref:DUF7703 domain-containing protein n=1 Tax=Penicillium alfredii TaxID=1506179 RepID=A0A9W9EGE9_9EURO|nr:uncharacterized protein NUU61_009570 [Penicillium alfredii]KAJ5081306.1 hypothetical protein NUU61_009570 [Penicillium alfredii]
MPCHPRAACLAPWPKRSSSPPALLFGNGAGNEAISIGVIIFVSIALYNALELAVLIPVSFQRYRTLYFWALLTSAMLGVIPAGLGTIFQFFSLTPLWVSLLLANIGFVMMVPNQSVVLYSRLHLVSQNHRMLRFLKWLIIVDTVLLLIPTISLNFGSAYVPTSPGWTKGFEVVERIQLTWFSAQETLISSVYIVETVRMIRLSPDGDKRRHKILYELLAINVVAIAMDLALLVLEFLGFYFTQIILKATVYSIKLKLEFAVLGMLVSIVHAHSSDPVWYGEWSPSGST